MFSGTISDLHRYTSVPEFFSGQTLLLTGGTGFVGKVFLEKVLRSCPGIEKVYLVVRSKKGVSFEERWKEITNVELFDTLKKENPMALDKVTLIEGDLKERNLGISDENWQVLSEEVNLIYHIAATVQFNNNIKDTLKENFISTYDMAEKARSMKNLKMFVYVSTTYSNFNRPEDEWEEQIYPAVQDWRVLLKLLDKEALSLSILQEKLLDGHPNAYTLSKSLAENLLQDYSQFYPVIIVRPSVVSAINNEPLQGWQDGMNGLASISVGVTLGIVRVFYCSLDDHQDFIPVDLVANTIAVASWKANNENVKSGMEVYNCTMGDLNIVNIRDLVTFLNDKNYIIASKHNLWTRSFIAASNYWVFYILFMFQMVIPFTVVDGILRLSGQKPRLIKLAIKIMVLTKMLKLMLFRQIKFPNQKYLALQSLLRKDDVTTFKITPPKLNPIEEISKSYNGILRHILHEDLSEKSIKKNEKRLNRIVLIDRIIKAVFCSWIFWLVLKWMSVPALLSQHM